jgi:hypothetical protein
VRRGNADRDVAGDSQFPLVMGNGCAHGNVSPARSADPTEYSKQSLSSAFLGMNDREAIKVMIEF